MRAAALTAVVLAIVFVLIWTQQRRLVYFPFGRVPHPGEMGVRATEVAFAASDGVTLGGWWFAPAGTPRFTVLVFNGNGGNRSMRAGLAHALIGRGFAVLLFDYRGFGGNGGSPSERGLREDARAAREYLVRRRDVDPKRLVYFGESLGTAVATELAVVYPPAALILRSPFTSLVEIGQHHYGWLPVAWLLRDRYSTIDRISQVRTPLLVIAGERDVIVPASYSRRVFERANHPKSLLVIPGADHNDNALFSGGELIGAVVRFLENLPEAGS